jgi:hypothetical protein
MSDQIAPMEITPPLTLGRRTLLRGVAAAAVAVGGGSALAACTGAKAPTGG